MVPYICAKHYANPLTPPLSLCSFTMNFSKGGSMIIAQYYQFLRLGFDGYRRIMSNLTNIASRLRRGIEETGPSPAHPPFLPCITLLLVAPASHPCFVTV